MHLSGYLQDAQVAGVLLTGSYATGVKVSRPFRYIRKLFDENHAAGIRHIARKYATGIILVDRGGVAELQREALTVLRRPIPSAAQYEQQLMKQQIFHDNALSFYGF